MSLPVQNGESPGAEALPEQNPILVPTEDQVTEKKAKFPGFNLYIKNLDDSFTDTTLREAFDTFGTITSAKVMCDATGKSRGFGFVCFTKEEEANHAVAQMNGRIVGTKPLYVAIAQTKEERKQYLSDKYKNMTIHSHRNHVSGSPITPHSSVESPNEAPPVLSATESSFVNSPAPLRYVPSNELSWHTNLPPQVSYVMPPNPSVAYVPVTYQPLVLLPNMYSRGPAQHSPMPIIHRPIYIGNPKTNTLIYSTDMPAHAPQMPVPGIQVYNSNLGHVESTGLAVHTIPVRDLASQDDNDVLSHGVQPTISAGGNALNNEQNDMHVPMNMKGISMP